MRSRGRQRVAVQNHETSRGHNPREGVGGSVVGDYTQGGENHLPERRADARVRSAPPWAFAALLVVQGVAAAEPGGFQVWDDSGGVVPVSFRHAVGPHHVVATRHREVRYFTRDGQLTYGSLTGLESQAVTFDPYARRFLLAGFGGDCGAASCVTLAVSDDEDPNGDWTVESVDVRQLLGAQYEGNEANLALGLDAELITVAWDSLPALVQYRRSWALVFDRASLLAGEVPLVNAFRTNDLSVSYAPAKCFGEAPAQYMVTTYGQLVGTNRLTFLAIRDPLDSPVFDTFIMDVPPFEYGPFAVPNLVLPAGIDSTGSGVLRSVYRDGSLWLAHHGRPADDGRVLAIWYEIATNGWPTSGDLPAIRQTGVVDPGPGVHTWIPDLAVDAEGTVMFTYARSAADQLHAVGWSFRLADDPPGLLTGHGIVRESDPVANFNPFPSHHAYNSSVADDPDVPGFFSAGGAYRRENQWGGVSLSMWAAEARSSRIFADGFESGDTSAW